MEFKCLGRDLGMHGKRQGANLFDNCEFDPKPRTLPTVVALMATILETTFAQGPPDVSGLSGAERLEIMRQSG